MPPRIESLPIIKNETTPPKEGAHNPERTDTKVKLDFENSLTTIVKKEVDKSPNRLLPWSKFMELSLYHPELGYYTRNVNIGDQKGKHDFTTAPEDIPTFGKHVFQPLLKVWEDMEKPNHFPIIEMGAGNGTLSYQSLSWTAEDEPQFHEATAYTIIERSSNLIEKQKDKLSKYSSQDKVKWHKGSAIDLQKLGIKNIKGAFITNELPDAFPVERVKKINGKVKQLYVTTEKDESENYTWVEFWGETSPEVDSFITKYRYNFKEGVEEPINLQAALWYENMTTALDTGVIVTIDYGHDGQIGTEEGISSIRCFGDRVPRNEEQDSFDPYRYLGKIDITTSINFGVFTEINSTNNLTTLISETQKKFLSRYNIHYELNMLKEKHGFLSKEYLSAKEKADSEYDYVLVTTKGNVNPNINPAIESPQTPKEIESSFQKLKHALKEEEIAALLEIIIFNLSDSDLNKEEIEERFTLGLSSIINPDSESDSSKIELINKILTERFKVPEEE